jgi:hypothetical protein
MPCVVAAKVKIRWEIEIESQSNKEREDVNYWVCTKQKLFLQSRFRFWEQGGD